jgi:hypothetical protein
MRGVAFAALVVGVGVVGCATGGGSGAPAFKTGSAALGEKGAAAPGQQKEIVVIGKGPTPMPGMKPQDEGTDFIMYHRVMYRCTGLKGRTVVNPEKMTNCRAVQSGDSRNPDPGREERAKTGTTPFK